MLPWPLVGVDSLGLVAALNAQAEHIFGTQGELLGTPIEKCLPKELLHVLNDEGEVPVPVILQSVSYQALCRPMGHHSTGRGQVLILIPAGACDE